MTAAGSPDKAEEDEVTCNGALTLQLNSVVEPGVETQATQTPTGALVGNLFCNTFEWLGGNGATIPWTTMGTMQIIQGVNVVVTGACVQAAIDGDFMVTDPNQESWSFHLHSDFAMGWGGLQISKVQEGGEATLAAEGFGAWAGSYNDNPDPDFGIGGGAEIYPNVPGSCPLRDVDGITFTEVNLTLDHMGSLKSAGNLR
jgi:hypothetical protein